MSTKVHSTGFGSNVARVELTFATVINRDRVSVYAFAGVPGREDWWTAREPIASYRSIDEARALIETLCGEIDAWRRFPVWSRTATRPVLTRKGE